MKKFGLIGYPLSHSFSKKYFTEKFRQEGLTNYSYDLFELQSITELPSLLEKESDLLGLNVTIPYKEVVIPYLDSLDNGIEYLFSFLKSKNALRFWCHPENHHQ